MPLSSFTAKLHNNPGEVRHIQLIPGNRGSSSTPLSGALLQHFTCTAEPFRAEGTVQQRALITLSLGKPTHSAGFEALLHRKPLIREPLLKKLFLFKLMQQPPLSYRCF